MLAMKSISLQSGSNGNAIYVEADGVRLLFDAGISGRQARERLARYDRSIREVDAVIISHDHADHIRCAGIWHRLFGLPVYMTKKTLRAVRVNLGRFKYLNFFESGDSLAFGRVIVHTIPTPHDAADGVVFVVQHNGKKLGICTDVGYPFPALQRALEEVDAVYLESNYDPCMLDVGPYPEYLKVRIRGRGGHISNEEAAKMVAACNAKRPKWIAVSHLSGENNTPELAVETQQKAVGMNYPVFVARRDGVSDLLEV